MAGLITISHKTPRRSATIVTGSRLVILRGCNAFSQTLKTPLHHLRTKKHLFTLSKSARNVD